MTEAELVAHQQIRSTMARYHMAGDRGKFDEFAATFTEDGVLVADTQTFTGRSGIAKGSAALVNHDPRLTFVRHHLTTSLIEVEGAQAKARSYFFVMTNAGPDHAGTYVDTLAKIGDEWLFTKRVARLDWTSPDSMFGKGVSR